MVKLKLFSPFCNREPSNNQGQGRRRSQRIQQQQLRKQQKEERQDRERFEESMNNMDCTNQRTSPGQRRSFDDIDPPNVRPGSSHVFSRIFLSNKKSRRSTSAAGRKNGGGASGGVIRRATTMLRPDSSLRRREAGATVLSSSEGSFDTLNIVDTSSDGLDMSAETVNPVLAWMQTDAPPDVLPKILSFCGSRKVNALSKVNMTWNNIILKNDLIWRVMCEDTYKWSEGDEIPNSWLEHYKLNPCLPFDYDSIDAAFEAISSGPRVSINEHGIRLSRRQQTKSARILLQPGPYFLHRSLMCHVVGTAHITIESMVGNDPKHGMVWSRNYNKSSEHDHSVISRTSSIISVNRPSSAYLSEAFGAFDGCSSSIPRENVNESSIIDIVEGIMNGNYPLSCVDGDNPAAFLIYEAQCENDPCIRIRQGAVTLRGLRILHYSNGTDIWNGNAAVQVQGPFHKRQAAPIEYPSIAPTANVIDCDIQSLSGRGIVSIDGGITRIEDCNIHNSAATGLYLGGVGSMATITRTDIYENGNGNDRARREGENVRRGHSGIYVEQGTVKVIDCNISKNSLTGMSGISETKATLQIENSDIISNGSVQLELPPRGSVSRDRSFSYSNNISAFVGMGRPRTRFLIEMINEACYASGPIGGQWRPVPQSPSEFPFDNVARTEPMVAIRAATN